MVLFASSVFWLAFEWYMIAAAASLVGIALIVAGDWLVYTRLPFVRWRMSQSGRREANLVRELMRTRRIKAQSVWRQDGQGDRP